MKCAIVPSAHRHILHAAVSHSLEVHDVVVARRVTVGIKENELIFVVEFYVFKIFLKV